MDAERLYEHLADRLSAIEHAASRHRAASIEGAMFCVMLTFGAADGLAAHEMERHEMAEANRRVQRLLYSALRALEAASGTPAAALGGNRYMPAALDPFPIVEVAIGERLAA